MAVYQCARCMKKFIDGRDMKLLCPFCRCGVLPYKGAPPINPCKTALIATDAPALPVPLAQQLSFHLIPLTDENTEFWSNYVKGMRMIAMNLPFSKSLKDGWANAVKGFTDALECYSESTPCGL